MTMHFSKTIERTFAVGTPPTLRVTHARGALAIRGEERDDIRITATLHLETFDPTGEEYLDRIEVPMSQQGDEVILGTAEYEDDDDEAGGIFGLFFGLARRPRVDIEARVPRRCAVNAAHRVGPTTIEGIVGDVHAESRAGRVRVEDVEGTVRIDGRTGQIEVERVQGSVSIESRTGRVDLHDIQGDLSCTNRTGAVQARDCDGPFRISSHTGAVAYQGAIAHEGSIEVQTGAITLAVPRDAAFFLDAESRRGSVRSDLPIDEQRGAAPEHAPTVRLRASTGSIRVTAR
jgi:hypothetical protein